MHMHWVQEGKTRSRGGSDAGNIAHLFLSSSNSVSLCPEIFVILCVSCSQWLLQLPALLLQLCKPVSLRCQPLLQRTVHRQPLAINKADVCQNVTWLWCKLQPVSPVVACLAAAAVQACEPELPTPPVMHKAQTVISTDIAESIGCL